MRGYEKIKLRDLPNIRNEVNPAKIYEVVDAIGPRGQEESRHVLVVNTNIEGISLLVDNAYKTYSTNQCESCIFNGFICEGMDTCHEYPYIDEKDVDIFSLYEDIIEEYEYDMSCNTITKLDAIKKLCTPDFCVHYHNCNKSASNSDCIIKILFDE